MISYTRTAKPCPQTHTANPEGWQSSRSSVSSTTPQHYVDGKNQKTLNIMLMEKPSRPDHCGQSNHCGGFCPWGRYASCVHSRSVLLSDLKTDHVERPFGSVLRQLHQLLVLWLYLGAGGTYVKHIWRHLCQKYLEASMSKKISGGTYAKLSGDTYAKNISRHVCRNYLEAPMSTLSGGTNAKRMSGDTRVPRPFRIPPGHLHPHCGLRNTCWLAGWFSN